MKILPVALAIGGGYLVLKYLGIDLLSSVGTMFGDAPVVSTPQASGPITPNIKELIAVAMSKDGHNPNSLASVDVWNWYYQKVRGINGPTPEDLFPNRDRNTNYSLDEYWAAMSGKGFSGLYSFHGMQGLGLISRMNPWINHYSPGPGRTILPLGSETFVRVFGAPN